MTTGFCRWRRCRWRRQEYGECESLGPYSYGLYSHSICIVMTSYGLYGYGAVGGGRNMGSVSPSAHMVMLWLTFCSKTCCKRSLLLLFPESGLSLKYNGIRIDWITPKPSWENNLTQSKFRLRLSNPTKSRFLSLVFILPNSTKSRFLVFSFCLSNPAKARFLAKPR